MKTPYITIGDASQAHAFLTSETGADVARLERITPDEWPDLEPDNYTTGEEWQHLIDIVNFAPDMAEFLVALRDKLQSGISPLPSDDFWNPVHKILSEIER